MFYADTLSNHFPARGRKRFRDVVDALPKGVPDDFQTTSPQGDGNGKERQGEQQHTATFKPLPRKGTETNEAALDAVEALDFQTTSPQGDGNIGW